MGSPPRNDTAAQLHEKDQEISKLQLQLKACAERASLAQSHLIATQNALDALQLSHYEELRTEQIAKRRLQQQLRAYYKLLELVNHEKDDLRNAVDSFLRRVQEPHTTWPRSQLHITSLLEPVEPELLMQQSAQHVSKDFDQTSLNYASAMVKSLIYERDLARKAHHSLLLESKGRIATLEAELAHRDLELEKYLSHCVDCPNFQSHLRTRTELEPLTLMDPSSLLITLQKTSSRHKVLKLGNRELKRQLEDVMPQTPVPPSLAMQVKHSVHENRTQASEMSPPINRDPPENISSTSKFIAQMNEAVRELGLTVQAFASERDQLQKMVAENAAFTSNSQDMTSDSDRIEPPSTTHLHDLYSSGKGNISMDQHEIESAYAASLSREKALIEENLKLVARLRLSHPSDAPDANIQAKEVLSPEPGLEQPILPSSSPPQLLDTEDGEISMDLATPLLPTTFIGSNSEKFGPESNTSGALKSPDPSIILTPALFSSIPFEQGQPPPSFEQSSSHLEEIETKESSNQPGSAGGEKDGGNELVFADQQIPESANAISELTDLVLELERTKLRD